MMKILHVAKFVSRVIYLVSGAFYHAHVETVFPIATHSDALYHYGFAAYLITTFVKFLVRNHNIK